MSVEMEQLKARLEKLDQFEHEQIFTIVRKHTKEYTRQGNGVFVSSKNISAECLADIKKYVDFCFDQREQMKKDNELRVQYEKLVKIE